MVFLELMMMGIGNNPNYDGLPASNAASSSSDDVHARKNQKTRTHTALDMLVLVYLQLVVATHDKDMLMSEVIHKFITDVASSVCTNLWETTQPIVICMYHVIKGSPECPNINSANTQFIRLPRELTHSVSTIWIGNYDKKGSPRLLCSILNCDERQRPLFESIMGDLYNNINLKKTVDEPICPIFFDV